MSMGSLEHLEANSVVASPTGEHLSYDKFFTSFLLHNDNRYDDNDLYSQPLEIYYIEN